MTSNRQLKLIRFLEKFWIVVGLVSLVFGVYETANVGINNAYIFFIFTLVSGILYMLRKNQRMRIEEKSKNE